MPVKTQRDFDAARERYRPAHIKILLVAEAPPPFESGRFFYFEDVKEHDSLFRETMTVLYGIAKMERSRKAEFLIRFKADGFFLIDACRLPIPKGVNNKRGETRKSLEDLKSRLRDLIKPDTKIILICRTVYDVCFRDLREAGFNIVNKGMIPHPAFGHQSDFRNKLGQVIANE
jgi:hypothetical protein